MLKGTVKWFNAKRGYGFITGEDGTDYFVHFSGINKEGYKAIRNNRAVTFELGKTEDGKDVAVNVTEVPKD